MLTATIYRWIKCAQSSRHMKSVQRKRTLLTLSCQRATSVCCVNAGKFDNKHKIPYFKPTSAISEQCYVTSHVHQCSLLKRDKKVETGLCTWKRKDELLVMKDHYIYGIISNYYYLKTSLSLMPFCDWWGLTPDLWLSVMGTGPQDIYAGLIKI